MNLPRQGMGFLLVGGIQLLVDWSIFVLATHRGMPVEWGNLLGRVCGASLGFWLNGRYTFADAGRSRVSRQALLRFGILWLATTVVSTLAVSALATTLGLAWAWQCKPAVDALLAVASFLISRHWIYRA